MSRSKPHQPAQIKPHDAGWKPAVRSGVFASPRFRSALPLALRFEAVLRVYNNPLPFARRLAARLRRAASLVKRVLNDGWMQLRGIIERTLHDELGPRVDTSVRQLCADSS